MVTSVLLVVGLVGPPQSARAAAGAIVTSAQGVRASLSLLSAVNLPLNTSQSTWQTGQPVSNTTTANANLPVLGTQVLGTGAVTTTAGPATGGGTAGAEVDNLNLLGTGTVGADAVKTSCTMTASDITGGTDTANLKLGGNTVLNPAVNQVVAIPSVATVTADKETATYSASTGKLAWTIQGLNVPLLGGAVAGVGSGTIVVAESTCTGIVTLDSIATTARTVVPGNTATPSVKVVNNGDVAAPNTVITIPAPPAGYTVGTVTTSGGGTCTPSTTQIRCTGVTVPGAGSVTVSLPVTLAASGANAANWAPTSGTITAVSTPIAALTGTTISVSGSGTLATTGSPVSSGSITVTPMTLAAGKSGSTPVTVTNQGPSDATTTVTIPLAGRPAGLTSVTAGVGSTPCSVTATAITCTGVNVPGNGSAVVTVKVTASSTAVPGTTWDLSNLTATLNGTAVTGQGRLLTISDPDVNLSGGVTINAVNGVPGGPGATPTVRVANTGLVPATSTTITLPVPPSGYTVGPVTTTGGGTCATGASTISCTGVTIPAMGTVTVSVPVTLASTVTADWTSTVAGPVTATSGDASGQATGAIVRARPDYTLGVDTSGPTPSPVQPGQTTTVTVDVTNQGPSAAPGAVFVVNAPNSTSFGPLTSPTSQYCVTQSPIALRCTATLAAGARITLTLPIVVSAQADPSGPLTGGCVSRNNDYDCGDAVDVALPAIQLMSQLSRRLTITPVPGTIVPGTSGYGRLRLTSTTNETNLHVVIPLSLPTGFHVTVVTTTASSGGCTLGAQIDCTGLALTAGQSIDIVITVTIDSSVAQSVKWTVTGLTVSDGTDTVNVNGTLAIADDPDWNVTADVDVPDDNTVEPGGTGTITVVLHNQGPSDATSVSFVILAPGSSTFQALTGPAAGLCTLASSTRAVCTINVLVANADSSQLIFTFLVADSADPDTPIRGCVDLDGVTGCGSHDVVIGPIVLRVPLDQQVSVTITTAAITPGRTGNGVLRITSRHGNLTNITVKIPLGGLPPGVQLQGQTAGSGSCSVDTTPQIICTGVTVTDGNSVDITLAISVTSATAAGTVWNLTTIVIQQGTYSITVRGRFVLVTQPQYDVNVAFTPPAAPIAPGGRGDITVTIGNAGPSDATNQTIIIIAPDGSTFASPLTGTALRYCTVVNPTRLSCTFDQTVQAAPLVLVITIVVSIAVDPGTPLTGGCYDVDNDGDCTSPPDVLMPGIPLTTQFNRQIDISTIPVSVDPITLRGTPGVRIASSTAQTNLTVTISLTGKPAQVSSVLATTTGGGVCSADVAGTAITCTGIAVAAGGSILITLTATVVSLTTDVEWFTPSIVVTNAGGDTATGAGLLLRTGAPLYTLSATITGPAQATLPGDTASLTASIDNTGTGTATNAVVNILAPFGTVFDTLTGLIGQSCHAVSAARITCLVTLAPSDANLVWRIPVSVPSNFDGTTVTGGCLDLGGDNACGTTWDVTFPDLPLRTPLRDITTVTSTNISVVPGGTGTGSITITIGQPRTGVTLVLPKSGLPTWLSILRIHYGSIDCVESADAYTCGPIDFTGGGSITLSVELRVDADATGGPAWSPAITVVFGTERYIRSVTVVTIGNPNAPVTVTVVGPADGTLYPGGTGDLRITLHNPGPSNARNLRYVFLAPSNTSFAALSPAVDAYCDRTSLTVVDCSVNVNVNVDVVFTLQIVVPPGADPDVDVDGGCVDTNFDGLCTGVDILIQVIHLGAGVFAGVLIDTDAGSPVVPGTISTGYVTVNAPAPITGLTVTVPLSTLPAGFTVTGFSGPQGALCTKTTAQIQCTDVTVTAGLHRVINLTVTTASSLPAGRQWIAYAIVVTRSGQSAQGNGLIMITGAPQSALTTTVTGPTGPVTPGGTASMTVTIVNTGPSDATNQTALVVAPDQMTFGPLSGRAARDCTVVDSTHLTCVFSVVANGPSVVWQLVLLVASSADPGQPTDGACVTVNDDDPVCGGTLSLRRQLARTTSVTLNPATIAPGNTGTPTVVVATTVDRTGLSLTIPLDALPAGFTVTGARYGSTGCALQSTQISCAGMSLNAGAQVTVALTVVVAASASATARWTPSSITLTEDGYPDDQLVTTGLLASTTAASSAVTVTVSGPTTNPAAPGQTTRLVINLHNAGPGDADPYVMVLVLPDGLTPGTPLPSSCLWDQTANTLRCETRITAGADVTLRLPLIVATTVPIGTLISGGCLDAPTSTSPYVFDYTCDDAGDQALPGVSVASPVVDLAIAYPGDTLQATLGGDPIWAGLTYNNNGSQSASNVTFTIDPPAGVTVTYAGILLDSSTAGAAGTGLTTTRYGKVRAAAELTQPDKSDLTDLSCAAEPDGDGNTVACTAPDAPIGASSQLWVQLTVADGAPQGTQTMHVTINTTSPEGKFVNNYSDVLLNINDTDALPDPTDSAEPTPTETDALPEPTSSATATATPTSPDDSSGNPGDGSDNDGNNPPPYYSGAPLPRTGQDVSGLLLLSVMLVVGGVASRIVARDRPRRQATDTTAGTI